MFKKLEDRKPETLQGKEPSTKGICTCSCKSAEPTNQDAVAAPTYALNQGVLDVHLNG